MLEKNKPTITIFTGIFGSGKTVLALNYSLYLSNKGYKTLLVDLDFINQYFRARNVNEYLNSFGVEVIASVGKLAYADIPVLPPAVRAVFEGGYNGRHVVVDIGGSEPGAIVLSCLKDILDKSGYDLYLVVNARRHLNSSIEDIIELKNAIELNSRARISALVSNTNLGQITDMSIVLEGHRTIEEAARIMGLPLAFLAADRNIAEDVRKAVDVPVLPLDLLLNMPWVNPG